MVPIFRQSLPDDESAPNRQELYLVQNARGWFIRKESGLDWNDKDDGKALAWGQAGEIPRVLHVPCWAKTVSYTHLTLPTNREV